MVEHEWVHRLLTHSCADRCGAVFYHAGQEPLLYVTVLLLSLQFRAAVVFMAQDPGTKAYRLDAVHLAIALLHHQLLDVSSQDAGVFYTLAIFAHGGVNFSPS